METKKLRKYLPTILTILGSGGVLSTGYFSIKAGAAIKDIALDDTKTKEQKRREIIKEAAPACISALVTIGLNTSSIILSENNANNIKTEMAAGYVLLQNGYNQYRKHIDQETHERALKKISEEKVKEVYVNVPVYIEGKYPWCDEYHSEPWYATEGDVYWAELKLKEIFCKTLEVSVHDFFQILREERGIYIPYSPMEEDLIWNYDVLIDEWESEEIIFNNYVDDTEDGGRIYTLEFPRPPHPRAEVKRMLKEMGAYYL